jgi:hypothetical protein
MKKPTDANHIKNPMAVALGKLAAGVPKNYSLEELAKRSLRLKDMHIARKAAKAAALSTR